MTENANGSGLLMCYNRGCGQKFNPDENTATSCTFHPGMPVFHDAYKSWSCCKKKTTDFTEFLNIKGCTMSYHSNVKPPEPEKPKADNDKKDEVCTFESHKPPEAAVRPSSATPMMKLPSTVAPSLKTALENLKQKISQNKDESQSEDQVVQVGTSCKNNGCTQESNEPRELQHNCNSFLEISDARTKGTCLEMYQGEHSNSETCYFHPGVPVFHEGMKYWSCCVRKTSDFNNFLEQAGCETGRHTWIKKQEPGEKKTTCRYDWHQTGAHVVISIYSKVPQPEVSYIEANPVKLRIHIVFGEENVFDMDMVLCGVVDIDKSCVTFLGSKVEIKLKKADATSWRNLLLPKDAIEKDVERCDSLDELEAKPIPLPKITEVE